MAEGGNWKYNKAAKYLQATASGQGNPYVYAVSTIQYRIEAAMRDGNQFNLGPAIDGAFVSNFPLQSRGEVSPDYKTAVKDAEEFLDSKYKRSAQILDVLKNNINLPIGQANPQHPMRMIESILQKNSKDGKSIYDGLSVNARANFKKEAEGILSIIHKYNKAHGKESVIKFMSEDVKAFVKKEWPSLYGEISGAKSTSIPTTGKATTSAKSLDITIENVHEAIGIVTNSSHHSLKIQINEKYQNNPKAVEQLSGVLKQLFPDTSPTIDAKAGTIEIGQSGSSIGKATGSLLDHKKLLTELIQERQQPILKKLAPELEAKELTNLIKAWKNAKGDYETQRKIGDQIADMLPTQYDREQGRADRGTGKKPMTAAGMVAFMGGNKHENGVELIKTLKSSNYPEAAIRFVNAAIETGEIRADNLGVRGIISTIPSNRVAQLPQEAQEVYNAKGK